MFHVHVHEYMHACRKLIVVFLFFFSTRALKNWFRSDGHTIYCVHFEWYRFAKTVDRVSAVSHYVACLLTCVPERSTKQSLILSVRAAGAGESGKSTLVKQMKIIHNEGFSRPELFTFKVSSKRQPMFVWSDLFRLQKKGLIKTTPSPQCLLSCSLPYSRTCCLPWSTCWVEWACFESTWTTPTIEYIFFQSVYEYINTVHWWQCSITGPRTNGAVLSAAIRPSRSQNLQQFGGGSALPVGGSWGAASSVPRVRVRTQRLCHLVSEIWIVKWIKE